MFNKLKLIVILVALVGGGAVLAYTRLFGKGTVHVLAVGRDGVEVLMDGQALAPRVSRGDHFKFDVPQGLHTVKVTDKGAGTSVSYTLEVKSGFNDFLLPVRADQCFASFDMTDAGYSRLGNSTDKDNLPPVRQRYKNDGAAIEVPSSTYFSFDDMPSKRRKRQHVYLLRDLPCGLVGDPQAVFAALSSRSDQLFEPMAGEEQPQRTASDTTP